MLQKKQENTLNHLQKRQKYSNLADRINCTNRKPANITLKEHKTNFETTPTCRLINPSKPRIGKISKHILDKINFEITKELHLNQWKNTNSILNWFNNIKKKNKKPTLSLSLTSLTFIHPSQLTY